MNGTAMHCFPLSMLYNLDEISKSVDISLFRKHLCDLMVETLMLQASWVVAYWPASVPTCWPQ
jgi:hypothetical protein